MRCRSGRKVGHGGYVRGEGLDLMQSDRRLQRAELVMVVAVLVLVLALIGYEVSRL